VANFFFSTLPVIKWTHSQINLIKKIIIFPKMATLFSQRNITLSGDIAVRVIAGIARIKRVRGERDKGS
jgi:hypothetical protein